MTDLNTLKNWFRTGLKPSQEQFWAWMDSFFHKGEQIPQSSIQDLDKSLENKAEISALNVKTNVDSSGLSAENIISWKEALGVGDLPTNIGFVDEGTKQGNVHTKEQIKELLENSGKNIGNTDLIVPAGTVRELDVTGAKLQIKGLEDKGNDASFNQKIVTNGRDIATRLAFDTVINMPENFAVTATVNHLYPNPVPAVPDYQEEVSNVINRIKNLNFTSIGKTDWNLWTTEDALIPHQNIREDGSLYLTNIAPGFNGNYSQKILSLSSTIQLPNDRHWVLRITGSIYDSYDGGSVYIGVSRGQGTEISTGIRTLRYNGVRFLEGEALYEGRNGLNIYLIKSETMITTLVYQAGRLIQSTRNAFPELGIYTPQIDLFHFNSQLSVSLHMAYAIL